jgi:hypothetical protein
VRASEVPDFLIKEYEKSLRFKQPLVQETFPRNVPVEVLEEFEFAGVIHYRVRFHDETFGAIGPEYINDWPC